MDLSGKNIVSPLVDTNTFVAIETLFSPCKSKPVDPWGEELLGHFANYAAYSDQIRFTLPLPDDKDPQDADNYPSIIRLFKDELKDNLQPEVYSTSHPLHIDPSVVDLEAVWEQFAKWARLHQGRLKTWLQTHFDQKDIQRLQQVQIGLNYVYDIEYFSDSRLKDEKVPSVNELSHELGIGSDKLLYSIDNCLRFYLYGLLAGDDQNYLNHDQRNATTIPQANVSRQLPKAQLPVDWSNLARAKAREYMNNLPGFVAWLAKLKSVCEYYGLRYPGHKITSPEALQKLGKEVEAPFRIKNPEMILTILSGGTSIAATALNFEPLAKDTVEEVVTVIGKIWIERPLPYWAGRSAEKYKWTKLIVERDLNPK